MATNVTLINDDAWLMFNNPALLSSVSDKTLALNYMNFMRGVNLAGVAYNKVIKERASAALSVNYVDYGKMRYTTADNQDLGEFAARDIAATAYFSYMLTDKLAGGIAAKVLSSSIGHYTSIGMGVDLWPELLRFPTANCRFRWWLRTWADSLKPTKTTTRRCR